MATTGAKGRKGGVTGAPALAEPSAPVPRKEPPDWRGIEDAAARLSHWVGHTVTERALAGYAMKGRVTISVRLKGAMAVPWVELTDVNAVRGAVFHEHAPSGRPLVPLSGIFDVAPGAGSAMLSEVVRRRFSGAAAFTPRVSLQEVLDAVGQRIKLIACDGSGNTFALLTNKPVEMDVSVNGEAAGWTEVFIDGRYTYAQPDEWPEPWWADIEPVFRADELRRLAAWISAEDDETVDAGSEGAGEIVAPGGTKYRLNQLATRQQLVDAFGRFTGMTMDWFQGKRIRSTPGLLRARKRPGTGGRRVVEPLFCPYEVMLWLIAKRQKKMARPLREFKGWELLKDRFPVAYAKYGSASPLD